jgi:F-box and leucine-rich repeat protein GRR1
MDPVNQLPHQLARHSFTSTASFNPAAGLSAQGITQVMHSANFDFRHRQNPEPRDLVMDRANTANSYYLAPASVSSDRLVPWPPMRSEPLYNITSSSSQELHSSVQSTFSPSTEAHEPEGRGRSVRRSLRNTFHAAEHFFFGRGSTSNGQASDSNAPNPWAQGNVNNTGDGSSDQPR